MYLHTVVFCSTVSDTIQLDLRVFSAAPVGSFTTFEGATRSAAGERRRLPISCTESKQSSRLLLWLVAVWPCGETVLVPQVLGQAVEESSYVTQTVADLPAWTHHGQARRLLEAPHFPLRHVAVHVKVKSKHDIKESLPVSLISRSKIFGLSWKNVLTLLFHDNRQIHKRILGANHQFDNIPPRLLGPLGDLIWQVIKRRSVSEGEEEKYSIHLLLTWLERQGIFFL